VLRRCTLFRTRPAYAIPSAALCMAALSMAALCVTALCMGMAALLTAVAVASAIEAAVDPASAPDSTANAAVSADTLRYPDRAEQQALIVQVRELLNSSRPDSAFGLITPLITPAQARGDSLFLLELLVHRSGGRAAYGQGARAETELRTAAVLASALGDTALLCQAVRWLSVAVSLQGRVDEAADYSRQLLDLARASGNRGQEGWALVGLGYYHLNREHAEQSVNAYRRAADVFRTERLSEAEIWAQNGLGLALRKLGRYGEAGDCFSRSLELALLLENPMNEAMARAFLGELEMAYGDPSKAEEHFRRAREIHLAHGHLREAVPPALDLARCQTELGRYRAAATGLLAALQLSEDQGYRDLKGIVLNRLAVLRRLQGQPSEAATLARRSLAIGSDIPVSIRVRSWLELSRALAAQDSSRAALAALAAGRYLLGDSPNSHLGIELDLERGGLLVAQHRPATALGYLRTASRRAANQGLAGYQVRLLVEQARAWRALARPDSALACLHNGIAVWEQDRDVPLDLEWRERRGAAGRALFHELAPLLLEHPRSLTPPQRVAVAFDFMQRYKARTLGERMRGPGAAANTTQRPVDLRSLQERVLRPGELLLDCYLGRDALLVFAVTQDSLRAIQLSGERDLASRFDLYRQLLATPSTGPDQTDILAAASRSICRLLWSEVDDLIAASETILWSPDGVLNLVPVGEIPQPASATPTHFGDRPRIRVPSASVLAQLRSAAAGRTAAANRPARILAIAGGGAAGSGLLPGAQSEVNWLARRFVQVEVSTDPAAAPGVVFGNLELAEFDVLHLAAHAVVDDQRPWNSSLHFGTPEAPVELTAGAVADLDLGARLAVLASCESGGGEVLSGEGVLGLTSGFLSAGVPTVLATLWPVDDRATALLIRHFYEGLASGHTAARALRNAQIALRHEPATAHPFYWAGFILVGDGTTTVPLAKRHRTVWPWIVGPLLLIGAVWPARWRRR